MTDQSYPSDWQQRVEAALSSIPGFHRSAIDASKYLRARLHEQEATRQVTDVLHGKQMGHPLHPVLTDLTIGSWSYGLVFDIFGRITGLKSMRKAGDILTLLGTVSAVPTALTGMTDFSAIKQDAAHYGAAHGLLNGLAFLCYVSSSIARLSGKRRGALFFSLLGMLISTVSAWLGGELVFKKRVGVNHVMQKEIETWAAAVPDSELPAGKLVRAEVEGVLVLLYRHEDRVHAIHAVCSHAGGPLEDGEIVDDVCVQCPWHQSVFDLRDGHVVHAPSTYGQPRYETRVRNGQIEVRSWREESVESLAPAAVSAAVSPMNQSLYDAPASQPELIWDDATTPDDVLSHPSQAEGDRDNV
jgi:nitrite reductase/ring-hydroxylating ferredoxin subunit/uncharacterized membrane protein